MLDFILFIIVVFLVLIPSVGSLKGFIFGVALLVSMMILPLILVFVLGFAYRRVFSRKNNSNKADDAIAGLRMSKNLSDIAEILSYIIIASLAYKLGNIYFFASLAGIAVKLIIDFFWGDLPFQKSKNAS